MVGLCIQNPGLRVQWVGRVMSIKNLFWESNYGGLWMYDFNSFVTQ